MKTLKSIYLISTAVIISFDAYAQETTTQYPPNQKTSITELNKNKPYLLSIDKLIGPGSFEKTDNSPFNCDPDQNKKLTYIPLPNFDVPNFTTYRIETDNTTHMQKLITEAQDWPIKPLTNEKDYAAINALLPNVSTEISILKTESSASFGGFFSGSYHDEYITIDFMKYRSEIIKNENGDTLMFGRIGAGLRLQLHITTSEANLAGNLYAIAASAKAGKTSGSINADVIGIDATDLTVAMPFTTDLSDASIQRVVEALAIVKSKMNDEKTKITPQFMSKMKCVNLLKK